MTDLFTHTKELLKERLADAVRAAVGKGELPQAELPAFDVSAPADRMHGDLAANIALVGARAFRKSPRDIAVAIVGNLSLSGLMLERPEIAGAGFINLRYTADFYRSIVRDILTLGESYGRSDYGRGKRVNVEYVSANPTGPMHIGNARGGALGDCLASVLDAAGYDVTREFYVNDAGNQINRFAASLEARYLMHYKGDGIEFPADGYQGADITEHAENYIAIHGDCLLNLPSDERQRALVEYALPKNLEGIKRDLLRYRIEYDVWFLESSLHQSGAVAESIELLKRSGHTVERDGAVWYRPPQREGAEPDKDEVLIRANGVPTYFAADIAYHYNKLVTRGFDSAILVWGADHHGHVARLKNAVAAMGLSPDRVDIVLMQLVRLVRDGEQVRVSKRTGKSISLIDLLDEVPLDAARFFFNIREPQSHLEFDLELAAKSSSENPVYYVQYAHARICSILRALGEEGVAADDCREFTAEPVADERELIRALSTLPSLIVESAEKRDPAMITRYCIDIATLYHRFYTNCRVRGCGDELQSSRVALCRAVKQTLGNCLALLKIDAPLTM